MQLKSITLMAGMAMSLLAGAAQALPSLPVQGTLEDDDKEYVLDASGNFKTSGSLVAGDSLWAVVNFNSINNPDNSKFADLGAGNAIYGISAITIDSIVSGVATFKPNTDFEATYGAGAMIALFTSGTPLDLGCADAATCEAAAQSGSLWMTLGFGDPDDFWMAGGVAPFTIGTDLSTVAGLNPSTKVAVANYALSVLTNNTGYTFEDQDCTLCAAIPGGDDKTQVIGSGDVLGGSGLAGEYIARSDFDFDFKRVPEPATLALLGMGLLGLRRSVRTRTAQ